LIVYCDVTERLTRITSNGFEVSGGIVRCQKCGHAVESFGATPSKALYGGMAKLSRTCPNREGNSYQPDTETKRETVEWQEQRMASRKGGAS
jgi:hypothetical protein